MIRYDKEYIDKLLLLKTFLSDDLICGLDGISAADGYTPFVFGKLVAAFRSKVNEFLGDEPVIKNFKGVVSHNIFSYDERSIEAVIEDGEDDAITGGSDLEYGLSVKKSPFWLTISDIDIPSIKEELLDYLLNNITWLDLPYESIKDYSNNNLKGLDEETKRLLDSAVKDIAEIACDRYGIDVSAWAKETLPFWYSAFLSIDDTFSASYSVTFGLLVLPFIRFYDSCKKEWGEQNEVVALTLQCIEHLKQPQYAYASFASEHLYGNECGTWWNLITNCACYDYTSEETGLKTMSRNYLLARKMFDSLVLYLDNIYHFLPQYLLNLNADK